MDEPDEAATEIDYWGGVAYDAYYRSCQGKNVRGEPIPTWANQTPEIRAHWYAAAKDVREAATT